MGLVSAYHAQSGEAQGEETVPTYMRGQGASFHLDYCFVSKSLAASANVCVLRGDDWPKRSDHFPIVLDIPDALLR
jgi:endonuclease/exonuclease/phosphatase family metal-dependent hydrolase